MSGCQLRQTYFIFHWTVNRLLIADDVSNQEKDKPEGGKITARTE
jgi:hypothetical protein